MLVQFTRRVRGPTGDPQLIAINPEDVSAVFNSQDDEEVVIVRMKNGQGFAIVGSYAEVLQRLEPTRQFDQTQQAE